MKKFLLAGLILFFPERLWAQRTITFANPLRTQDFRVFIENIINIIFTISLPLAVVMLIFSAILIVTASDNEAQVEKGKKLIVYILAGLAIVLTTRGIVALIEYLVR